MFRAWLARLRRLLFRRHTIDELRRELAANAAIAAEDAPGHVPSAGEVGVVEAVWEAGTFPALESVLADLRYALRTLTRQPGFALAAILSLALGIGANTAVFSVLDSLALRPLPVAEPHRLVSITSPEAGDFGFPAAFFHYFESLPGLSSVGGIYTTDRSGIVYQDAAAEPGSVSVGLVTPGYFPTLGLQPAIGRLPDPGRPTALISHRLWQRRFAGASDVAGHTFTLNHVVYTISGVMPRAFSGDVPGRPVDIWIPLSQQVRVLTERDDGQAPFLRILGRLAPGVARSAVAAPAQAALMRAVEEQLPERRRRFWSHDQASVDSAANGMSSRRQAYLQPLIALMAIVGTVLLISSANVANLLLARAAARRRELWIRVAIGASRLRIVRQLMTENFLLAAVGGAMALLVAPWGASVLVKAAGTGLVPFWVDTPLDRRVFAFNAALSLLTAIVCGLVPAWRAARDRWSAGRRTSRALVIVQVALSLTLVVSAGLLVRSLSNLRSRDTGFARERVLLAWTVPEQAGRDSAATARLFADVPRRVSQLPGVVSASASLIGLLEGAYSTSNGSPTPNVVAPGFFATTGIHFLAGRDFGPRDTTNAPPVAIINQSLARAQFGETNPIGKRIPFRRGELEVVGVVGDALVNTLREDHRQMLFLPYSQGGAPLFSMCVAVRVAGDPRVVSGLLRDAIHDVDRDLPVLKIDTLQEQLEQSLLDDRLMALAATAFGGLAAFLAAIGLYGVMSYSIARRTAEFGIRLALGAERRALFLQVLAESLRLVVGGVLLGLPLVTVVGRLLGSRLFGVPPLDPVTTVWSIAGLCVTGVAATAVPALRATRVDPGVALRWE